MGFKAKARKVKIAKGRLDKKNQRIKDAIAPKKKPCGPNECSGCCGPSPKDPFTMV